MPNIDKIIPLLIPVLIIQLFLQIYAVINLVRRKNVRFGNKYIWGVIIILGGIVGSVAYFALRGDEE